MSDDRYEPLPSVWRLPGFLIGKLSPRARRLFWLGAGLALVALVVGTALLVPEIRENKREDERQERLDAARSLAERKRRIATEQRPRSARAEAAGAASLEESLKRAIVADVALRLRAGTVQNPAIRAECKRLGTLGARIAWSCTAVTSDLPGGDVSRAGFVGYPYRAIGDPRSRRFTFCKVAGVPGEGANRGRPLVELPRACAG